MADPDGNVENLARPWRRTARAGIYEPHLIRNDPRSERGARRLLVAEVTG
ncbi:hypothetical protein [Kutzneria kofuensis]